MTRHKQPRKRPVQARSRETVEVILRAAVQVFSQRGYTGTTTTRVARRAGVSVGSLYQYFPDKDALLLALWERHAQQAHALLIDELDDPALLVQPVSAVMRRLADAMLRLHTREPGLHRVLSEQLPQRGPAVQAKRRTEADVLDRAVRLFEAHPAIITPHATRAAHVVGQVLESFSHWYVLEEPDLGLTEDAFVDEMGRLAMLYLTSPR